MTATTNPRLGGKANTPYILAQCGTPIGKAPSGTMAANGAVTLGTALNTTYSGGLWMYYPAGAVYAGSVAGFYWTVMSSTTVGTVYDNIYVPGTNSWDIQASPTAIVAAGPGAFTGVTSVITAVSVTLPGGSLGNHGGLRQSHLISVPNNANAKNKGTLLGGIGIAGYVSGNMASKGHSGYFGTLRNMGVQNKNVMPGYAVDSSDGNANNVTVTSIDTSVDNAYVLTLSTSVATDWAILNGLLLEVFPS